MVQFTPLQHCREIMVCFIIIFTITSSQAQTIGTPFVNVNNGACASEDFNTFSTLFSFEPTDFAGDNEFIIELSDANGDFDDPALEVGRASITIPDTPLFFSIPTDTSGEEYEIRIRSTSPERVSQGSQSFASYFRIHDTEFSINNLTSNASFCPGSGFLLSIDETSLFPDTVSPLDFDNLTFNWFKVIDDTTNEEIPSDGTFQLQVLEAGTYFAATDYGTCSVLAISNSISNRITIIEAIGDNPATAVITSSLGNPFCSPGEGTVLTTITGGDTYQWFRNDDPIDGANGNTLQTNESGNYAVIITTTGCDSVGSIEIESLGGVTTIDAAAVNFIESGGSLLVTVDTTVDDVQYEWFLNDNIIDGATENTFTATTVGNYIVRVTGIGDCDFVTELQFELRIIVDADNIPNLVTPNGDSINDTWTIPAEYVSGTNTEIIIVSSTGETVVDTTEYINNWPENPDALGNGNQIFYYMINPESEESIRGSITVIR